MRCLILTTLLLAAVAWAIAQGDGAFVGTYRTVLRDAKTGFVIDGERATQQPRWLRLERSGKWTWRDQRSAYYGTWTTSGSKLVLTFANGLSGPARYKGPMVFQTSRSGRVLTLRQEDKRLRLEMVWDPTLETLPPKGGHGTLRRMRHE